MAFPDSEGTEQSVSTAFKAERVFQHGRYDDSPPLTRRRFLHRSALLAGTALGAESLLAVC